MAVLTSAGAYFVSWSLHFCLFVTAGRHCCIAFVSFIRGVSSYCASLLVRAGVTCIIQCDVECEFRALPVAAAALVAATPPAAAAATAASRHHLWLTERIGEEKKGARLVRGAAPTPSTRRDLRLYEPGPESAQAPGKASLPTRCVCERMWSCILVLRV